MKVLKINSSVQPFDKSVSRQLVNQVVDQITNEEDTVVERDLTTGISLLSQEMVTAFYTPSDQVTEAQQDLLAESNQLVAEIQAADTIVLGVPIYNFSVPGSVKAYFDLIARVGVTFKYSEQGPIGLLEGKKVYVAMASGGTAFRSEVDFASDYIKHFLSFIGITDVQFVDATQLMFGREKAIQRAEQTIATLPKSQVVA